MRKNNCGLRWTLAVVVAFLIGLTVIVHNSFGADWTVKQRFQIAPDWAIIELVEDLDSIWAASYCDTCDSTGGWFDDSLYTTIEIDETKSNKLAITICYPGLSPTTYELDYFPKSGNCGTGLYSCTFYVQDTSDTPSSLVVNPYLAVYSSGGDKLAGVTVADDGIETYSLPTGSNYQARAYKPGYGFLTTTFSVSADDDSIAVKGWELSTGGLPTGPGQIAISGNLTKITGDVGTDLFGYNIKVIPKTTVQKRATEAGGEIVLPVAGEGTTDSTGAFSINVIASDEYSDSTFGIYTVVCSQAGEEMFRVEGLWLTDDISLTDTIGVSR